jgi:nitroreductase
MMDVKDAIHARRARRTIDTRPVPEQNVNELVEAMRLAPSCNNYQPWRVVVARSPESLEKVKAALSKGNVWATRSPLILVIAARPDDDCKLSEGRDYFLFGCGLAVGEMVLRATELGMIAHPIAGYDPVRVKESLGIPNEYVVIALVICGFPSIDASLLSEKQIALEKERPARKPIGENFFDDAWGRPMT